MPQSPRPRSRPDLPLYLRLGLEGERDPRGSVRLAPTPQLTSHGVLRSAVLVLMVDMMGGFIAEAEADGDWVFTTDLSLRTQPITPPASLEARGNPLRMGRRTSAAEIEVRDGAGAVFAYGHTGFARVPRRHGDPEQPHLNAQPLLTPTPPITRPLLEELGAQVLDASRGCVEVALQPRLLNPAQVLQGSMVALVAEAAAEALAGHHGSGPTIVSDTDIRYLAMGRSGPIRTEAAFVGPPADGRVRAALFDAGNADRLVAAVLLRVERP